MCLGARFAQRVWYPNGASAFRADIVASLTHLPPSYLMRLFTTILLVAASARVGEMMV